MSDDSTAKKTGAPVMGPVTAYTETASGRVTAFQVTEDGIELTIDSHSAIVFTCANTSAMHAATVSSAITALTAGYPVHLTVGTPLRLLAQTATTSPSGVARTRIRALTVGPAPFPA